MQTLKKFLTHRGALSAAATHLGVSAPTVLRWKRGEWKPSADAQRRIDAMLSTLVFDVSAKSLKKLTWRPTEEKNGRKSHNRNFAAK